MNNFTFKKNDKVGIVGCSDGLPNSYGQKLEELLDILRNIGLQPILSKAIYRKQGPFSGSPKERAEELMKFYGQRDVKAIFDISGGDSANQILDYIDFDLIRRNPKPYFGISDNSVILNSIFRCSKIPSYHYSIKNFLKNSSKLQIEKFKNTFFNNSDELYKFDYKWVQGYEMNGIVVGGNIRCFLKLAGTRFFPDTKDKILFLESLSGGPNRIGALIYQLKQMGCFDDIRGILLGTFSEMEKSELQPDVISILLEALEGRDIPIAKTSQLGHGEDAICIRIGQELVIK